MVKVGLFLFLFALYVGYSFLVYRPGTQSKLFLSAAETRMVRQGKDLYQQYNCTSCHQLYGLGGFLGPDLTIAYSDPQRGENFIRAILKSGGSRMPDFHFSNSEIDALTAFLKYVDSTAISYKPLR